jgi:phage shock protein PspC (stress-responsive transcriptional regulator)
MHSSKGNLLTREDTFLGVCEGLGEDFGVNPIFLRLAFAGGLLWNPEVMIVAYLALAVVVAFSRLIAPKPRAAAPSEVPQESEELAVAA